MASDVEPAFAHPLHDGGVPVREEAAGDLAVEHIATGRLLRILSDWTMTYPGYHLYYASRRASPAITLVVAALRIPT